MTDRQRGEQRRGRAARRGRAGGFTLVELMLGIVLGGFILSLFTGSLVTTFKLFQRGAERASFNGQSQTTLNQIAKDLTGAITVRQGQAGFRGQREALEFLQSAPGAANGLGSLPHEGGVRRVAFRVRYAANGKGVIEKLFLPVGEDGTPAAVNATTLARNVRRFSLSYFDGATWRPTWQERFLPRAVRIALEFASTRQGHDAFAGGATVAVIPAAP